jgi:hypothetical protein
MHYSHEFINLRLISLLETEIFIHIDDAKLMRIPEPPPQRFGIICYEVGRSGRRARPPEPMRRLDEGF